MILLDTHIWVKWVLDERQLPEYACRQIAEHEENGLGVRETEKNICPVVQDALQVSISKLQRYEH